MKTIKMECPHCGASLFIDASQKNAVCEYCKSIVPIDDGTITYTINKRIINETEIKKLEIQKMQLENQEYHRREEQARLDARKKEWKEWLIIWLLAVAVLYGLAQIIEPISKIWPLVFVGGLIAIVHLRPKNEQADSSEMPGRSSMQTIYYQPASPKNRGTVFILWMILGFFGAHLFYVGRVGKGMLYLFTAGLFGIGWIIDLFQILGGTFKDANGLEVK